MFEALQKNYSNFVTMMMDQQINGL